MIWNKKSDLRNAYELFREDDDPAMNKKFKERYKEVKQMLKSSVRQKRDEQEYYYEQLEKITHLAEEQELRLANTLPVLHGFLAMLSEERRLFMPENIQAKMQSDFMTTQGKLLYF